MIARQAPVAPLLAALLLAAACGRSEERASDIALHQAIERLRSATSDSPEQRLLKIVEVESIRASTAVAVEAQRTCAAAYRDLTSAEDATSKAELDMKMEVTLGRRPSPSDAVIAEVAAAERMLARAKEAMPACDAAAARLAVAAR